MPDKNNPPIVKTTRRSARRHGNDPVVAPGFGTKKDLEKLGRDLNAGAENQMPMEAVEGTVRKRVVVGLCVCFSRQAYGPCTAPLSCQP
jgi:hypothetical protein